MLAPKCPQPDYSGQLASRWTKDSKLNNAPTLIFSYLQGSEQCLENLESLENLDIGLKCLENLETSITNLENLENEL